MHLAIIEGNATATIAHSSLRGCRLLICQPVNSEGMPTETPSLVVDSIGAGLHSRVIVTTDGSLVQQRANDPKSPVRNMVMGIVDEPKKENVL